MDIIIETLYDYVGTLRYNNCAETLLVHGYLNVTSTFFSPFTIVCHYKKLFELCGHWLILCPQTAIAKNPAIQLAGMLKHNLHCIALGGLTLQDLITKI